MLETPHVAVGAAIATAFPNPIVAIPLCLVSHVVLDKIPHWNPHTYTETQKYGYPRKETFAIAIGDMVLAGGFGLYVANSALPDTSSAILILVCCLVSVLPDIIKYPFFVFKSLRNGWLKRYVLFERTLQVDTSFVPGVLTQLLVIGTSLLWIYG